MPFWIIDDLAYFYAIMLYKSKHPSRDSAILESIGGCLPIQDPDCLIMVVDWLRELSYEDEELVS